MSKQPTLGVSFNIVFCELAAKVDCFETLGLGVCFYIFSPWHLQNSISNALIFNVHLLHRTGGHVGLAWCHELNGSQNLVVILLKLSTPCQLSRGVGPRGVGPLDFCFLGSVCNIYIPILQCIAFRDQIAFFIGWTLLLHRAAIPINLRLNLSCSVLGGCGRFPVNINEQLTTDVFGFLCTGCFKSRTRHTSSYGYSLRYPCMPLAHTTLTILKMISANPHN